MTDHLSHLQLINVSFVYEDGKTPVEALTTISLDLSKGEFVCILGPSGCGKTTLLRILGGLIPPTQGDVLFDGTPLRSPTRRVGIIFQQNTLFPWLTVRQNILFALKSLMPSRVEQENRARDLARLVGLADFINTLPGGLSGGMSQRANLARALATEPEILLMDEPFGSLDAISRLQMHEVLVDIWKRLGMSIVFVTHDVDEAVSLADRIFIMTHRPGTFAGEVQISLDRPRIKDGIQRQGFEIFRNEVAASARDLYLNNTRINSTTYHFFQNSPDHLS